MPDTTTAEEMLNMLRGGGSPDRGREAANRKRLELQQENNRLRESNRHRALQDRVRAGTAIPEPRVLLEMLRGEND